MRHFVYMKPGSEPEAIARAVSESESHQTCVVLHTGLGTPERADRFIPANPPFDVAHVSTEPGNPADLPVGYGSFVHVSIVRKRQSGV